MLQQWRENRMANKNKFKGRKQPNTNSNQSKVGATTSQGMDESTGKPIRKKGFGANPQGKTTKGKKKASY